jgi:hypothetical protein
VSSADDRDLERYLRRDDALSRAYAELKSQRPSPALDQAVLARARDALKEPPRASLRQRNWTAITAIAATVLLSFGLVMRVALEPEAQLPATPAQAPAQPSPAAAAQDGALEKKGSTSLTSPPNAEPPSSIESQRPAIEEEIRAASEEAPETSQPTPAAAALERQAAPPAPAAAPALNEGRREIAPAVQPMRQDREAVTRERASGLMKQSEPPRELDSTAVAGTAATADQAAKAEIALTPEAWLAEIERLRAAGEFEAAERELASFRKAYPDYVEKLEPQSQRQ